MSKRSDRDFVRCYRSMVCLIFPLCLEYKVPLDLFFLLCPDSFNSTSLSRSDILSYLAANSSSVHLFIDTFLLAIQKLNLSDSPKDPG